MKSLLLRRYFLHCLYCLVSSSDAVAKYITPIGDHTCEGFITEDSSHIVPEQVVVQEKYHETCWNPAELFKCPKHREVIETQFIKKEGLITREAIVCCEGYKQIGEKCFLDKEKRNSIAVKTIIVCVLVLSSLLLIIAFVIPTFLYLREKRRRIHLEDLEHDPDIFSRANIRQAAGNGQANNIYTLAVPVENNESYYESIDESREQPPSYDSCAIDDSLRRAVFNRQPPPYSDEVEFREHGYDKLTFSQMNSVDMSYGKQELPHSSDGYNKLQCKYKCIESPSDHKTPGSSHM